MLSKSRFTFPRKIKFIGGGEKNELGKRYGNAPIAGARAFARIIQSNTINDTGLTYERTSGIRVNVTFPYAHSYIVGENIYLDSLTGSVVDGVYTILAVTEFTITFWSSGANTTGTCSILRQIANDDSCFNVSSVANIGTGISMINFKVPMFSNGFAVATGPRKSNGIGGGLSYEFLPSGYSVSRDLNHVIIANAANSSTAQLLADGIINVVVFQ